MYVRGGYNVYPVEVEAVLSAHDGVAAVAIVPRAGPGDGRDRRRGRGPARPGRARRRSTSSARSRRDRLAAYKLPEAIAIVESLPLTAGEKVDRARPRTAELGRA